MVITLSWAAGSVILAILGHAFFTVWHASRINTTVLNVAKSLEGIKDELKKRDDQITAAWKKIDMINNRLTVVETKVKIKNHEDL